MKVHSQSTGEFCSSDDFRFPTQGRSYSPSHFWIPVSQFQLSLAVVVHQRHTLCPLCLANKYSLRRAFACMIDWLLPGHIDPPYCTMLQHQTSNTDPYLNLRNCSDHLFFKKDHQGISNYHLGQGYHQYESQSCEANFISSKGLDLKLKAGFTRRRPRE